MNQESTTSPAAPQIDRVYSTLLVLLNIGSQGLQALLAPITRELEADLEITQSSVGLLQSGFLVVYAFATPFWAFAASRYQRHRLLVFSTLLWGICCVLVTMTDNMTWFLIGFWLAAIGNAAIVPVSYSMMVDVIPPSERGIAFGWLSTGQTLSYGLAFLLGGMLGERVGWQAPFWAFATFAGLGVLSLLTIRRYEPQHGAMEAELQELFEQGGSYSFRIQFSDLFNLFKPISNLYLVASSVLSMIPLGAVSFWFIAMLREDHGLAGRHATYLTLGMFLVQVPGAVMIGRISDLMSVERENAKVWFILGCLLLTTPCYIIAFLIPWTTASLASAPFVWFLVFVVIAAFVSCGAPPLTFSAMSEINKPENRAVLFSLLAIGLMLGRAIGVHLLSLVTTGWFEERISPGLAVLTLILIPAAICMVPVIARAASDRQKVREHLANYVADEQTEPE